MITEPAHDVLLGCYFGNDISWLLHELSQEYKHQKWITTIKDREWAVRISKEGFVRIDSIKDALIRYN